MARQQTQSTRVAIEVIAQYVECGFDSDQIASELLKQGIKLDVSFIEADISIVLGEQS